MQIQRFVVNMIEENTYLLYDKKGNAALIDCGAFYPEEKSSIKNFIIDKQLNLTHLLNTHAHFDHLFGVDFICESFHISLEINRAEKDIYESAPLQTRLFMQQEIPLVLPSKVSFFNDGDVINIGNIKLTVISTPGHTPGGVCFYDEDHKILFSGDSLFRGQIGRCDFPGGNEHQLIKMLKERILTLPDDVQVFPGHGDSTTIGYERLYNPFLR